MSSDLLKELRDLCLRREIPQPVIEIVQQSYTPEGPEFFACCTVASIKRYGKANTKMAARQLAAMKMLAVNSMDEGPLSANQKFTRSTKEKEAQRRSMSHRDVKLCDRHNYYKNFFPHLKKAAFEVINSTEYKTKKDQLLSLLSALKITPEFSTIPTISGKTMVKVELDVDFDNVFFEYETNIYAHMIDYFKDMLV